MNPDFQQAANTLKLADTMLYTPRLNDFRAQQQVASPSHHTLAAAPSFNNSYAGRVDPLEATRHLRDAVYMSPQLVNLTNTLRSKKKCQAGHLGGGNCPQVRQEQQQPELLDGEVVFRAVSPHGHVYWEIDPKANNGSSSVVTVSDEDESRAIQTSSSDMSRTSRQSSSRYSDNRPLIAVNNNSSSGESTPQVLVNPFADVQLLSNSVTSSPVKSNLSESSSSRRFSSLRNNSQQHFRNHQLIHGTRKKNSLTPAEHLQEQVQIRDLRSIPVNIKSNEYILAKIQDHMTRGGSPPTLVATTPTLNGDIRSSPRQRKVWNDSF